MIKVINRILWPSSSYVLMLMFLFIALPNELNAIEITNTHLKTHHDKIPRFCNEPNVSGVVRNTKAGNWSDPSVWDNGQVPGAGSKVQIILGTQVDYDLNRSDVVQCIEVHGKLNFAKNQSTSLWLDDGILVMPTGTLEIGSRANPINSSVTAEIVFADTALKTGTVTNPGLDPYQMGKGVLVFGKIEVNGRGLDKTFYRLATEASAGDSVLTLSQVPSNWQVGDRVLIPDTRQIPFTKAYRTVTHAEEVQIASISGNQISLASPLKHDHFGPKDHLGNLRNDMLADVINLTRNVRLRSESSETLLRGHLIGFHMASVNIRYAEFKDMGRTTTAALDSTKEDANGLITHIGANQIARYSIHFHHVAGPANPSNTGFQFEVVGNLINGGKKWGITVHNTHFGNISHNVAYAVEGSAIVTEHGNETENLFEHNISVGVRSGEERRGDTQATRGGIRDSGADIGWDHSAFWFRGPNNRVRNNVAWNQNFAGFVYNGYYLKSGDLLFPKFRGSKFHSSSDHYKLAKGEAIPLLESRNNEIHASGWGMYVSWYAGCCSVSRYILEGLFKDYKLSHINQRGVYGYHNSRTSFDGFTMINDLAVSNKNGGGTLRFNTGFYFNNQSYENGQLAVKNFYVSNFNYGIQLSPNLQDGTAEANVANFDNGFLRNHINVLVPVPTLVESSETFLKDIAFELASFDPSVRLIHPAPRNIVTSPRLSSQSNPMALQRVYAINYNRVVGNNFEIFFNEQGPDEIVLPPQRDSYLGNPLKTCPEQNITYQQCWDRYGVALAGQVAPCLARDGDSSCLAASSRASLLDIHGLIFDFVGTPPQPPTTKPRLLVSNPLPGLEVQKGNIAVTYQLTGDSRGVTDVFFKIGNLTPIVSTKLGSTIYFKNVPPGDYQFLGQARDANAVAVPGTVQQFNFRVVDNGSNNGNTDSDGDGLSDQDESNGYGTDPSKVDTDGDGVSDAMEVLQGSDPLDANSFIPSGNKISCAPWSSFLRPIVNIQENRNNSLSLINASSTFFDHRGRHVETIPFSVKARGQTDLLYHEIFTKHKMFDAYGIACTTHSGAAEDLDSTMVYYKINTKRDRREFQYAFAIQATTGLPGPQFIQVNSHQASLAPEDRNNFVAVWNRITNRSSTKEGGTLTFFDSSGVEMLKERLVLDPEERRDIDAHRFGRAFAGMIAWRPDRISSEVLFDFASTRYFYDNPQLLNNFATVMDFPASTGIGHFQTVPLDTAGKSAIIEISNAAPVANTFDAIITDSDGNSVKNITQTLAPYSTVHLITDSILAGKQGIAKIYSSVRKGLVVSAMHYIRKGNGAVDNSYAIPGQLAIGDQLHTSYNLHLEQNGILWVANTRDSTQTALLSMVRQDGVTVIDKVRIQIPANGLKLVDLSSYEQSANHGAITLEMLERGSLVAGVLREKENEFVISTVASPRFK